MEKNQNQTMEKEKEAAKQQVTTTEKKPFYKKKGFWGGLLAAGLVIGGAIYGVNRFKKSGSKSEPEVEEETPRKQLHEDRGSGNRDWRNNNNRHERNNNSINN